MSPGRPGQWVAGVAALGALCLAGCFNPGEPSLTSVGSAGETTTTAATTAGETTTGGETTAGETTAGETTGEETVGEFGMPTAYRIESIALVDPHLYHDLNADTCQDATALVNFGISSEAENGQVNQVLVLYPADPQLPSAPLRIARATCNAALDTCSLSLAEGSTLTTAENKLMGTCTVFQVPTLNPDYAMPNVSSAPCFAGIGAEGSLRLDDKLPPVVLQEFGASATYDDPEAPKGLVKGVLRGYLTQSAGEAVDDVILQEQVPGGIPFNLWGTIAGGAGCQPDPENPIDDTDPNPDPTSDEPGVWVYFNFTASPVEWLE